MDFMFSHERKDTWSVEKMITNQSCTNHEFCFEKLYKFLQKNIDDIPEKFITFIYVPSWMLSKLSNITSIKWIRPLSQLVEHENASTYGSFKIEGRLFNICANSIWCSTEEHLKVRVYDSDKLSYMKLQTKYPSVDVPSETNTYIFSGSNGETIGTSVTPKNNATTYYSSGTKKKITAISSKVYIVRGKNNDTNSKTTVHQHSRKER